MAHKRKKRRTQKKAIEEAEAAERAKVPKSFVVKSGKVGRSVAALVRDFRQVMEPNTASQLRERASNKIRDYVNIAGPLGVTHFMMFSQTDVGTNLRIARLPRGPTLTFRVVKYSLAKDCLALQKSPKAPGSEYRIAPLLLLNNFGSPADNEDDSTRKRFKLMTAMLQNLFPAINPAKMVLADIRRVVLFNYNAETDTIDFRHYVITVKPVGVTKGIKKIITNSDMPDMGKFEDVSEYVLREAFASESDIEDGAESSVTLAQNYVGRGNRKSEQRAVRLVEAGPRMELKLLKIEAGLCEGDVLYHSYIHKTEVEVKEVEKRRQKILAEKARRRKEQEENVARKKTEEEAKKQRSQDFAANPKPQDGSKYDSDGDDDDDEVGSIHEADDGYSEEESSDISEDERDEVLDFDAKGGASYGDEFGADNLFTEDDDDIASGSDGNASESQASSGGEGGKAGGQKDSLKPQAYGTQERDQETPFKAIMKVTSVSSRLIGTSGRGGQCPSAE
ncbi:rRNA-binding ribosome biosynthesis protein [Spiromyces aspiralis]|uniref:rRNA-binding ribosome biosynthesis protein n=1 Tax=Spiromyces aspiralis TaxID=68401 RepID=A0ACC1HKW9_9FUNG|nr:rRNA-binding ribosome biosynthesis protein [Spiromyces aspiralis]